MVNFCTRFINYDNRYQPSPESIEKSKDGKDLDEEEVSNMKDNLTQKSAEKWIKAVMYISYVLNICYSSYMS